jgi:1,2-diacylglycerol 3-beta-glucosyltransferase
LEAITALVVLIIVYGYISAAVAIRETPASPSPATEEPFFVLLVPMLNEEQVITQTITSLLGLYGRFLILLVDDDSHDGTLAVVQPFLSDSRVHLLRRPTQEARTGKGAVLNAGLAEVRRLGLSETYGAANVVVVVFDADTRVEPHFLKVVAEYFRDPRTAGVQSAVRMYNAGRNLLTFWQHFEFVVWGELFARAKDRLGSATLGGNGQFVRLSALEQLGQQPWRTSLTEDLDLSLRLLGRGWRLRFCPTVSVRQEALPNLRALVRQRSRWLQGHLVAWSELPTLLRGPLTLRAKLDLLVFLLLPATALPIGLASVLSWIVFCLDFGRWEPNGLIDSYLLAFGAAPLLALAWRRASGGDSLKAVAHGHMFVLYSYVWFLASVLATWHVLLGRRAWAKTSRAAVAPGG